MTGRLDQAKVAEAARLYHALSLTEAEVARVMQVSERTVRRWLAGTARRTGPRARSDVNDALILDLKDQGLSFRAIALRVHMSKTGARLRYYALTGRERPDRPKTAAGNGGTGETS